MLNLYSHSDSLYKHDSWNGHELKSQIEQSDIGFSIRNFSVPIDADGCKLTLYYIGLLYDKRNFGVPTSNTLEASHFGISLT